MYVCHCRAVTDRSIKAAVRAGARDAIDVGERCGAGTGCGGCLPALEALLAQLGAHPLTLVGDGRPRLTAGHAA